MNLFALFLLSHIGCDFIFQSDQMAQCKRSTKLGVKWWPLCKHALTQVPLVLILWGGGWLMAPPTWPHWQPLLIGLVIIVMSHWLIDLFKQNSQPLLKAQLHLTSNRVPVMSYTIDQALHLIVIGLVSMFLGQQWAFNHVNRLLLAVSIVLSTLLFADYFISFYLKGLDLNMDRLPDGAKLGRHIGHLERFAILILFYTHNVASIAVIVAIKALTRFKAIESNEHHFVEYYLIGSLLSLIFGCLGGYLLSLIAH